MKGGFKNKKPGFNKRTGFKETGGFDNPGGLDRSKAKRNGLKKTKRKEKRKNERWNEIVKCDRAFSQYIRLSNADKNGYVKCFTCNKVGFWKKDGIECGHYVSRSNMSTRWLTANAKPQCTYCNQVLGGNLEIYRQRLHTSIVRGDLEQIDSMYQKVEKLSQDAVRSLRLKIERKVREIRKEKGL